MLPQVKFQAWVRLNKENLFKVCQHFLSFVLLLLLLLLLLFADIESQMSLKLLFTTFTKAMCNIYENDHFCYFSTTGPPEEWSLWYKTLIILLTVETFSEVFQKSKPIAQAGLKQRLL